MKFFIVSEMKAAVRFVRFGKVGEINRVTAIAGICLGSLLRLAKTSVYRRSRYYERQIRVLYLPLAVRFVPRNLDVKRSPGVHRNSLDDDVRSYSALR